MPKAGATRTHIYMPRVVVGLGGNVEMGANFNFFDSGWVQSFFQPNIK